MPRRRKSSVHQSHTGLITESTRQRFHAIRLRKALQRRHTPCPTCGWVRLLCTQCVRVYCAKCDNGVCPRCVPITQSLPIPTQSLAYARTARGTAISSTKEKRNHKKQGQRTSSQPPSIVSVPVPPAFKAWAETLIRLGYTVKSFVKTEGQQDRFDTQVLVPETREFQKPEFSSGWYDHHLYAFSVMPVKNGRLVSATLGIKP